MAFKLKSGNRTSFKMMGSSPVNLGWKKFGMDPSDIEATGEKSGDSPAELGIPRKLLRVLGCTDPTATNYNPKATVDNGSCKYEEETEKEPKKPASKTKVSKGSPAELNLYKKYQKGKKFLKKLLGYETKKPIDKTKEAVNWDFEQIKKALKSQFEERR